MKKIMTIFILCALWSGIAISHDEEIYTQNGYPIKSTNKDFVKISEQKQLAFKNKSDDIPGRFLYDQEDITNDYQVHIIYILASDSEDKKYDVNDTIKKIVLKTNDHFYINNNKIFRLDLTKEGKLDISFIRVDKKKKKISRIQNGAGYFTAEIIKHGFYNPKKLYAIFYQDYYKREWGQVGNAIFYGPNKMIEINTSVTYLEKIPLKGALRERVYLHELIHALGFVQLCAPGAIKDTGPWGKNDHLNYRDDVMSDSGGENWYIDKKRIEYYDNSIPNCEMDLKKSAFLEPTEKDFQLQPMSKSCKLTRWQPKYNHQRSLDCLARLNF